MEASTSIFPDSIQLTRIHSAFPGRHFRYLPGNMNPTTGTVDDYFGIIEGDPRDEHDVATLRTLINEVGPIYVHLVLGDADWSPPPAGFTHVPISS